MNERVLHEPTRRSGVVTDTLGLLSQVVFDDTGGAGWVKSNDLTTLPELTGDDVTALRELLAFQSGKKERKLPWRSYEDQLSDAARELWLYLPSYTLRAEVARWKKANAIARANGYGAATTVLLGDRDAVIDHTPYGYRKHTTGEYVSNAYRRNFGWKNTYYQRAQTTVCLAV